ncbi:MAG: NADH-quinone oxidoreductase subunit N [Chitinophagaceae bacterium]|nr:NADH-quinone oxidoreductase subunit N [Chitinophagaceae bacterium]
MNAIVISAFWGILMMLGGVVFKNKYHPKYLAITGVIVLIALNLLEFFTGPLIELPVFDMLKTSSFGLHFNTIAFTATLFILLLNGKEFKELGLHVSEYFGLIFFALIGVAIATSYNTLLLLLLGIELMVVPLYFLTGINYGNLKNSEASLKFFLTGAFFSAVIIMGITLIYGGNQLGSFYINFIALGKTDVNPLIMAGMILMLVGMAFKVSAAPFHFWAPDVYDGTPSVISSFLSTIMQTAAFVAFFRLFKTTFGQIQHEWQLLIIILIVASLLIGNITSVFQQSVKRMLAYSAIAHMGFLLMGILPSTDLATEGVILYIAAYTLATLGMYGVIGRMQDYTLEGFNGLGKKAPRLAFFTTIFLLSLTGIPLTAGFLGKFYILLQVATLEGMEWLILLSVLNIVLAAVYYFRIIRAMYFRPVTDEERGDVKGIPLLIFGIIALLTVLLGIMPDILTSWIYY